MAAQQDTPSDYVVAIGRTVSLAYFAERVFAKLGLDWRDHVISDPALCRPTDIRFSRANPERAHRVLGWFHTMEVEDVISEMIAARIA